MKGFRGIVAALSFAVLPCPVQAQFFSDNFDSYATGSTIMGQGGWETWDNNPAANTTVVNTQAFTPPNSLLVAGTADIVHQFAGVNSGIWYAKAKVFVPAGQTGEMWFILLNTYVSGPGTDDWSVQAVMCASGCTTTGAQPGMVVNFGPATTPLGSTPLVTNQWVEIRAEVNLTTNQYSLFYNGVLFDTQTWTLTGLQQIQAMDLFSNGSSQSFMDDIWLDTTLPVELMGFSVK